MFKKRILPLVVGVLLMIGILGNLPFSNLSAQEDVNTDELINGFNNIRVDGFFDNLAPEGYLNEWGDARTSEISFQSVQGQEFSGIQLYEKILADQVMIGLKIPLNTVTPDQVKVIYDVNYDNELSNGDARLVLNLDENQLNDHIDVQIYNNEEFISYYDWNPEQSMVKLLDITKIADAGSMFFEDQVTVELSFYPNVFGDIFNTETYYTDTQSDTGSISYSLMMFQSDENIALGYPVAPLYLDNSGDYVLDSFDTSYFDKIVPLTLSVDIGVSNLEVTQSVQTASNDLSLVQEKPTLARVSINNPEDTSLEVEVKLYGYSFELFDIRELGMLSKTFQAPISVNRENLDDTANFVLPESWTEIPSLILKAEVTPVNYVDQNTHDNDKVDFFNFIDTHDMNIYYVQVNEEGTSTSPVLMSDIDPDFIPQALDDFRALYPSANINFIELGWETLGVVYGGGDVIKSKLNDLAGSIIGSIIYDLISGVEDTLPMPDQMFAFRTRGSGSSSPSWNDYALSISSWGGLDTARGPMTLAHELNHNLGNDTWGRHVPGCDAGGPDSAWPDTEDQTIDIVYSDTLGWNHETGNLVDDSTFDLMSYCIGDTYPYSWVSDYRWEHLVNKLSTYTGGDPYRLGILQQLTNLQDSSTTSPEMEIDASTEGTTRIVSGFVTPDNTGTLNPSYTVNGTYDFGRPQETSNDPSYYLEVLYSDQTSEIIEITPSFDGHETVHEPQSRYPFSFWLPDNDTIFAINLLDAQGNTIDSLSSSGLTKEGILSVPSSIERNSDINLDYQNQFSENTTNIYTKLQYSHDGSIWYDLGPQTLGFLPAVQINTLPGGGQVEFRLRVSNGFDSYYLYGDQASSISDLPPEMSINDNYDKSSPLLYTVGSNVQFSANAYDPESGNIHTDTSYNWQVFDVNGQLLQSSDGKRLDFSVLDKGTYSIDVTVFDSAQNTASDSITIEITGGAYADLETYNSFLEGLQDDSVETTSTPTETDDTDASFDLPLKFNVWIISLLVISSIVQIKRGKLNN